MYPPKTEGFWRTKTGLRSTLANLLDFSSATVGSGADGSLIKAGTSASPISGSTLASRNFIQLYLKTEDTAGSVRGIYNRLYITGVGGGGESLRTFTTINNVAGGTAHGAHISLNFGTSGTLSGLGVAARCTLHVANAATGCGTGTFAPIQSEIYGDGATSTIASATEVSFLRMIVDEAAAGVAATVDTSGFLFSIQGLTAGTGKLQEEGTGMGTVTGTLKVKLGANTRYIPYYSSPG